MATITSYPFVTHLRTPATSYVQHLAHGTLKHEGVGSSFWFRRLPAVLSEVPVDDREQAVLVKVRASDLQEVNVPGVVTYRIAQPATAAARVDFGIDAKGRRHGPRSCRRRDHSRAHRTAPGPDPHE